MPYCDCSLADPHDYPWGTIIDEQGKKRVVCRCINIQCRYFSGCRPDFDPAELAVIEENKHARSSLFEYEESKRKKHGVDEGDAAASARLFCGDKPEQKGNEGETGRPLQKKPDNNPFVIPAPVPPAPAPVEDKEINFASFRESTQEEIIEVDADQRSVVNAGPGTGKTWTLIEKIIYMINEGGVEAENILVLCFSRSAVEVVRKRLAAAADAGRMGYEWQDVDVRTFDSFSTYLLAWIQENDKDLLVS